MMIYQDSSSNKSTENWKVIIYVLGISLTTSQLALRIHQSIEQPQLNRLPVNHDETPPPDTDWSSGLFGRQVGREVREKKGGGRRICVSEGARGLESREGWSEDGLLAVTKRCGQLSGQLSPVLAQ